MALSILDIVNDCLAVLKESAVESVEDSDYSTDILSLITRKKSELLARGWWFNKETRTLTTDSVGHIIIPDDYISVIPVQLMAQQRYVKRGSMLYDLHTGSFELGTLSLACDVIRDLPWDALESEVQEVIAARVAQKFAMRVVSNSTDDQKLLLAVRTAEANLNARHIRESKSNLFQHGSLGHRKLMATANMNLRRL